VRIAQCPALAGQRVKAADENDRQIPVLMGHWNPCDVFPSNHYSWGIDATISQQRGLLTTGRRILPLKDLPARSMEARGTLRR